jgi:hypothetical protein
MADDTVRRGPGKPLVNKNPLMGGEGLPDGMQNAAQEVSTPVHSAPTDNIEDSLGAEVLKEFEQPNMETGQHRTPGEHESGSPQGYKAFAHLDGTEFLKEAANVDPFYLSPELCSRLKMEGASQFGIPEDGVVVNIRNPEHANWKGKEDRITDLRGIYGDCRRLLTASGVPYGRIDSIFVVVPKKPKENRQAVIDSDFTMWAKDLRPSTRNDDALESREELGYITPEGPRHLSDDEIIENNRIRSRQYEEARMIGAGSPTSGLTLEQATSLYSSDQVLEEREMYRSMGEGHRETTLESWGKLVASKQFGMGETGFANPRQKQAAVRARAKA